MTTSPIQKAIASCDNSKAIFARLVGVTPAMVWQWEKGRRPVPATRCVDIEQATGGTVTRYDLRPDVFGEAPAKSEAA
jgi:DNA-binding transcriptional regulator YdaS (Cro superfamily)